MRMLPRNILMDNTMWADVCVHAAKQKRSAGSVVRDFVADGLKALALDEKPDDEPKEKQ